VDSDCISSFFTYQYMDEMCMDPNISLSSNPDSYFDENEQPNKTVIIDSGRIYKLPFTFSLYSLLPKCRYCSSIVYDLFTEPDDTDNTGKDAFRRDMDLLPISVLLILFLVFNYQRRISRTIGEDIWNRFEIHQQRFHGYPAKQMVQWSTMCQSRIGNVGYRTADATRRRRVFRRFSHVGLWNSSRRSHTLLRTRFLSLRTAKTPANASRLDMEKSKHDVS